MFHEVLNFKNTNEKKIAVLIPAKNEQKHKKSNFVI